LKSNLETICPMCNLIHHAGQGCVVQGNVDLFRKATYSQNTIIQLTRSMRAKGKNDQEALQLLQMENLRKSRMRKRL
jgi:hypothetical protein